MKKISIIIPVYNVAEYLAGCLESVLQQNFNDYEIICVDDASTDDSGNILEFYEKKYDKIKVIKHTQNKGLSAARNKGLEYAVGKYVWFVDSDDMISEGALAELYDIAEKNETDLICFNMLLINKKINRKSELLFHIDKEDENVYSGKEMFCLLINENIWANSACLKFIRKDFLTENQIKFYEGILHEDVLFSFYCTIQAERVINTKEIYYICQQRETSITAQKTHKSAESNFVIMMHLIVYWHTHTFTERENDALKKFIWNRYYNGYLYYDRYGQRSKKLEVGGPVEKALYDILYNEKPDKKVKFDDMQLEHIKSMKNVVVFGASYYAADVIDILKENGIKINAVAVNSMEFNPIVFCGIPVDTINRVLSNIEGDIVFVMGISKKNIMNVKQQLELLGYKDIIVPIYKI